MERYGYILWRLRLRETWDHREREGVRECVWERECGREREREIMSLQCVVYEPPKS